MFAKAGYSRNELHGAAVRQGIAYVAIRLRQDLDFLKGFGVSNLDLSSERDLLDEMLRISGTVYRHKGIGRNKSD
jgi:hypothetical protein